MINVQNAKRFRTSIFNVQFCWTKKKNIFLKKQTDSNAAALVCMYNCTYIEITLLVFCQKQALNTSCSLNYRRVFSWGQKVSVWSAWVTGIYGVWILHDAALSFLPCFRMHNENGSPGVPDFWDSFDKSSRVQGINVSTFLTAVRSRHQRQLLYLAEFAILLIENIQRLECSISKLIHQC